MEISYGLVNLMYFMLCGELSRIKGSRSNKRRKLLTCFTNSLFKVYNNLSLRETGPEVYNITTEFRPAEKYRYIKVYLCLHFSEMCGVYESPCMCCTLTYYFSPADSEFFLAHVDLPKHRYQEYPQVRFLRNTT